LVHSSLRVFAVNSLRLKPAIFLQAIATLSSRGFLSYVLALEFLMFDHSLLDNQLLAKSQILHHQTTSADKQAAK
jgi:hypothetical protein